MRMRAGSLQLPGGVDHVGGWRAHLKSIGRADSCEQPRRTRRSGRSFAALRRHCAACSSDATMVERPGARVGGRGSHSALTGSTELSPAMHAAVSLMIAAVLVAIWLLSSHRKRDLQ